MPIIHDGKQIVGRLHGGAPLVKKYHGDKLVWTKHLEYRIPFEYQEVEYIEANGAKIKLNYQPTVKTQIDCTFIRKSQQSGEQYLFHTYPNNSSAKRCSCMLVSGSTTKHSRAIFGNVNNENDEIRISPIPADTIQKLKLNSAYFVLNDEEYKFKHSSVTLPEMDYMWVFGTRSGANASARMYSFKVNEDGVIKVNLVPCYRKSDRKPGMYDTITDTFYVSETNVDFLVGADVKCAKLEYIENPNENFIDLKLKMNSAYSTEIDYQYNKYTVGFLFGSRSSNTDRTNPSTDPNKAYSVLLGTTKENFDVCNVFSSAARYQQDYDSNRRKVRINKESLWIDGNKKKSFNKDAFITVNSAFIFSCPYCLIGDTKTVGFVDAKIYSIAIKDVNDVLKMNLIPYKIGDNAGLLDTVSKVFFTGELVGKPFTTKESRRR